VEKNIVGGVTKAKDEFRADKFGKLLSKGFKDFGLYVAAFFDTIRYLFTAVGLALCGSGR
jgi:hypothetical protein